MLKKIEKTKQILDLANSGMSFLKYLGALICGVFAIYMHFTYAIESLKHEINELKQTLSYTNNNRKSEIDRLSLKIDELDKTTHNLEIEFITNNCRPIKNHYLKHQE